jgi:hypothetical protein
MPTHSALQVSESMGKHNSALDRKDNFQNNNYATKKARATQFPAEEGNIILAVISECIFTSLME